MGNDKAFVRDAFAAIAPRYDRLNTILSLGAEIHWRRRAVKLLDPSPGERLLDLCAGTLTLSRDMDEKARGGAALVCADFCLEMLALGRTRVRADQAKRLALACADAETLPFRDALFDAALVAYGIRNLGNQQKGILEIHRVLRPGGRLVILDFLRPRLFGFSWVYGVYLRRILPLLGGILSGSRSAYQHLTDSIQGFMEPDVLLKMLKETGFEKATVQRLTLGVAGLFHAVKP